MIPYEIYKFVHVLSVFLILFALGGLVIHVINGGDKYHKSKKLLASLHGIGTLLALVAGFGLLARIGRSPAEPWVLAKLGVWIIFGGYSFVLFKTKKHAKLHIFVVLLLASLAIFMAQNKPMF